MRGLAVSCFALPVVSIVGCAPGYSDEDYDDVAEGIGALTATENGGGDADSMIDSVALVQGLVPAGFTATGSGSFTGLRGGLMYAYSVTCLDGEGATTACDASPSSGDVEVSWSGEVTTPTITGSLARTGSWHVSGMQSDVAAFEGDGTFDVSAEWTTLRGYRRTYELSYEGEYVALGFRTTDQAIVRGTIRWDVHARRVIHRGDEHAEAELDVEAVLTFSGDGTAMLVLDGKRRYTVDSRTGAVTRL